MSWATPIISRQGPSRAPVFTCFEMGSCAGKNWRAKVWLQSRLAEFLHDRSLQTPGLESTGYPLAGDILHSPSQWEYLAQRQVPGKAAPQQRPQSALRVPQEE